MNSFIVGDPKRCIGCKACVVACGEVHRREGERSFLPRIALVSTAEVTIPIHCRQCENAPCVAACPEGALCFRDGRVVGDPSRCMGCKQCVLACRFGAIALSENEASAPLKCDLCFNCSESPVCVAVCPAQALALVRSEALHDDLFHRQKRALNALHLS